MTDATNRSADPIGAAGDAAGMPSQEAWPAVEEYTPGSDNDDYISTSSSNGSGMTDQAKDEAAHVASQAGQSATDLKDTAAAKTADVVGTATDKATETIHEAKDQVRELYSRSRDEISQQAGSQQSKLAGGLRSLSGELGSMADGTQEGGMAADLVRQVSSYADRAGEWLDSREPTDVLEEVGRYARRQPGTFLLLAAGLGLVAGRVARAMKDSSADSSQDATASVPSGLSGTGSAAYSADTGYTSSMAYPATGSTAGAVSPGWEPTPGAGLDDQLTDSSSPYGSAGSR